MRSTTVRRDLHDMDADAFPDWYQEALDSSSTGTDSGASTDRRRRSKYGRGATPALGTSPMPSESGPRPTEESYLGVDLCGTTLSTPTEDKDGATSTAPPLLLTIEEAAERLTVGRCTMQKLVLSGEVRSFKIGTKLRRIPPEALDEYIARKMQP
jgi:excisionase family DNA binding protein